jgi:hypothetical protein
MLAAPLFAALLAAHFLSRDLALSPLLAITIRLGLDRERRQQRRASERR